MEKFDAVDFNLLDKYLRYQYKIPKEYNLFVTHSEDITYLIDKKKVATHYTKHGLPYGLWDYGHSKVINIFLIGTLSYLFKYSKFKTEKEVNEHIFDKGKKIVNPGNYKIKIDNGRVILEEIEIIEESIEPILNKDIFSEIKKEISLFLKNEKLYNEHNLPYKRGLLFYGPPGTGKTLTTRYLLNKYKDSINLVVTDLNDLAILDKISELIANETIKDTLKIIVIEDLDGLAPYLRATFLNLIDGLTGGNKVIFFATTNYPEKLDSAIKNRPSRFDSYYLLDSPNQKSRSKFIKYYFSNLNSKEIDRAVKATKGLRGSHFKELFLLSKLERISIFDAVKKLNEKFSIFTEFESEKEDYFG